MVKAHWQSQSRHLPNYKILDEQKGGVLFSEGREVKFCMKKNARRTTSVIKKSDVFSTDGQPIEGVFADMSERLLKIQRDLLMPAFIFEKNKVQNTITFFGSARIKPESVAKKMLADVKKNPKAKDYKAKLKSAQKAVAMSKYYTCAEELARRLQEWVNAQHLPDEGKYYIMTGGGPGIMEAANKGAFIAGGKSVGATILISDEQHRNDYVDTSVWFDFNYFLMRKFWLLFFAKAIVVFPGGAGTLDELFEVFTLVKTHKAQGKIPMVLFDGAFWKKIVNFPALVEADVITEKDMELLTFVDSVDEAFDTITGAIGERLK